MLITDWLFSCCSVELTKSRTSQIPVLLQWADAQEAQEAAWPGQLTWTGQRDIPHCRTSPQCTNWAELAGSHCSLLENRLGIHQCPIMWAIVLWIICSSSVLFLSLPIFFGWWWWWCFGLFQLLTCSYFKAWDLPFLCNFPPCCVNGGGWVSGCIAQSCQLGLNHGTWLNHAAHACTRNWGKLLASIMKIHIVNDNKWEKYMLHTVSVFS